MKTDYFKTAMPRTRDFDVKRYAEKLVRAGREGVKWEIRKLEWIREEKRKMIEEASLEDKRDL